MFSITTGTSDGSAGSEVTSAVRTSRSFTIGDSDHSDIDPDDWGVVSDTGGSSSRTASQSVFSKGSGGKSRQRRRRQAHRVQKVADTVKKLVPWPAKVCNDDYGILITECPVFKLVLLVMN